MPFHFPLQIHGAEYPVPNAPYPISYAPLLWHFHMEIAYDDNERNLL